MVCVAKYGSAFRDFSILTGQQYRNGQNPLWGFDFQYDKYSRSCTRHTNYRGWGVNYNFNENKSELAIKSMWNPTRQIFWVTRSTKIYPYFFTQASFLQDKIAGPNQ